MSAENPFTRSEWLLGEAAMNRLKSSRVALFGVGGVGGHCAEALARCGVGRFVMMDMDTVSLTNLNRQAVALHSTLGQPKA
ncbi:MAG: ThiF family adenylyltransferase, partial [Oscillospiraceae bacterium]|nr:ThiF family adenylyltransferase [Oscillospiraceae bacterium]